MHLLLSDHPLHVIKWMAEQLGLSVVHQVVPEPGTNRQWFGRVTGFEMDPIRVPTGFSRAKPGVRCGRSLGIAAVLTIPHVPPQCLDDRPTG